jgi:hypothetical protein
MSKNDLDSLGVFSLASSTNIGNAYGAKTPELSRTRGRQFTTSPGKKGNDATFSPFTSISVGDAYVTPEQRRRQYEREKNSRMIVSTPFRPSNPTQRSSGHGTMAHYGIFSSYTYMKTSQDVDPKSQRKPLAPRNFLTSPPKRGTYGFAGLNIGGKPDGVMGEFSYSSIPDVPKERPKTQDLRPFSPTSPAKKGTYGMVGLNIGGKTLGHNNEFAYTSDGLFNRPRTGAKSPVTPFVPTSPSRTGGGIYGTVGQYPEYSPDPEVAKVQAGPFSIEALFSHFSP